MKKIIILGFILAFGVLSLYCQRVGQIDSIIHNREALKWTYRGSIQGFDNRLFVNNMFHISEYTIMENGNIEEIYSYRTGTSYTFLLIDDDVLYSFYFLNDKYHMVLFDLNTIPMSYQNSFEIPILSPNTRFVPLVMDDLIIIPSFHDEMVITFDKTEHNFEFFFEDFYPSAVHNSYFLTTNSIQGSPDILVMFHDFSLADEENPFGILSHNLRVELDTYRRFMFYKVENDFLSLFFEGFLVIYNISDMNNITKFLSYAHTDFSKPIPEFWDAIFYSDLLISTHGKGITIFDISDTNNIYDIYDNAPPYFSGDHDLTYLYNDQLFVNGNSSFQIYDLKEYITFVSTIGISSFDIFSSNCDYLMINYYSSPMMSIKSFWEENSEFINIDTGLSSGTVVASFKVIEDQLYVLSLGNGFTYFSIYDLNSSDLLYRYQLPSNISNMRVLKDHIIFKEGAIADYARQFVYEYSDFNLIYIGDFVGILGEVTTFEPDDYFIVNLGNRIEFRASFNPLIELHSESNMSSGMYDLVQVDRNTLSYRAANRVYFYTYDEGFTNFQRISTMYYSSSYRLQFYDGYMSVNTIDNSSITNFYSIENGIPKHIGEVDLFCYVSSGWISNDLGQMAILTGSAYHIYDINFVVPESDITLVHDGSRLLGNYPNPFNPTTEIAFYVESKEHVKIDVFNIRGQKIRSLVNEFYSAGSHKVLWNGFDDNGNSVASGVYLYRMLVGDYTDTRRMVLMK